MAHLYEQVGAPTATATPPPQDGDIWMRMVGTTRWQPYMYNSALATAVGGPAAGWIGMMPAGGNAAQHGAKRTAGTAAPYFSEWVDAIAGMVVVRHQQADADEWVLAHQLQSSWVDLTVIKKLSDWTWNAGTSTWTDPQPSRAATIVIPKDIIFLNTNQVRAQFAVPIAGVAVIRR